MRATSLVRSQPSASSTAAPGREAAFDLALTNVGNTSGSFPVTLTLPGPDWTLITNNQSPITLFAGQTHTETITLAVPSETPLGRFYTTRIDSPAPGTVYTQTTFAAVRVVSTNALPIYQAAQTVAELYPEEVSLPAALDFLALSIDDLDQACAAGQQILDLRDRVASGALAVANHADLLSPLLTAGDALRQIALALALAGDKAASFTQLYPSFTSVGLHASGFSMTSLLTRTPAGRESVGRC